MIVFESPHSKYTGTLELPEHDDFTGAMFNLYRDQLEARGAAEDRNLIDLSRRAAYAGGFVIDKYGKWGIKGLPFEAFSAWENEPDKENVRFVRWVGKTFAEYYRAVTDPNA